MGVSQWEKTVVGSLLSVAPGCPVSLSREEESPRETKRLPWTRLPALAESPLPNPPAPPVRISLQKEGSQARPPTTKPQMLISDVAHS